MIIQILINFKFSVSEASNNAVVEDKVGQEIFERVEEEREEEKENPRKRKRKGEETRQVQVGPELVLK